MNAPVCAHTRSDDCGTEDCSSGDFTYGFAAGLNFKLSKGMSLWSEARYMARGDTKFIPILIGLQFGGGGN